MLEKIYDPKEDSQEALEETVEKEGSQVIQTLDVDEKITHLFPYIGYRENALYFTYQLEKNKTHPFNDWYHNSDYVLIDLGVNPYPFTKDEVKQKFERLKKRKDLVLTYQDGRRFLFERKTS